MPKRKADEESGSDREPSGSDEEEAYKPPKKVPKKQPKAKKAAAAAAATAAAGGPGAPPAPAPPAPVPRLAGEADAELEAPIAGGGGGSGSDKDSDAEFQDDAEFKAQHTAQREAEAERMRHILASFTPAQLHRYECFRRSILSRKSVKKLAAAVAGAAPSLPTLVVLGGLGKQFVGELVEEGRRVMADRGEAGPLRPVHVQEAHRRLASRGKVFDKASRAPLLGGRSAAARVRL